MNDFGYFEALLRNFKKVNDTQSENIQKAAALMVDAIENDRVISVYGGGGHTTLWVKCSSVQADLRVLILLWKQDFLFLIRH